MGCLFSPPEGLCQTGLDPSSFIPKRLPTADRATRLMGNSPEAQREDHTTIKAAGVAVNKVTFSLEVSRIEKRMQGASVKG